jgi:hypothetical protein
VPVLTLVDAGTVVLTSNQPERGRPGLQSGAWRKHWPSTVEIRLSPGF